MEKLEVAQFLIALPSEIMELILEMLDIVDYHSFSAVCRTWRSIAMAAKHKQRFSLRQRPWLMLSSNNNSEDDYHGFFSLDHGKIFKLKLPEVVGCRCCGSSWGWLIMANEIGGNFLLNPFSRLKIQLPSQTTLKSPGRHPLIGDMEYWWKGKSYIRKAMLLKPPLQQHRPAMSSTTASTSGNCVADNCIVVAIYECRKFCFCRPGDQVWTDSRTMHELFDFEDMILFNDGLYAVTSNYDLVIIELDPHLKGTKVNMPCPEGHRRNINNLIVKQDDELIYLVESCGELLMVVRHLDIHVTAEILRNSIPLRVTTTFKVFKFDSSGGGGGGGGCHWIEVESLGDQMLFVGTNGGISISASLCPGFRGNCIYFTDENFWMVLFICDGPKECRDVGVFSLEDGTIESFFPTDCQSSLSPPIWFMPN